MTKRSAEQAQIGPGGWVSSRSAAATVVVASGGGCLAVLTIGFLRSAALRSE